MMIYREKPSDAQKVYDKLFEKSLAKIKAEKKLGWSFLLALRKQEMRNAP